MTYQLTQGNTILRLADDAHIPQDPANRDYVEYLAWLEEGNEPEPAPAPPVLTTEQLMYPGAFLLRDALDVWLRGGSRPEMRMAAARAYAANQKISVNAAAGVFSKLE